LNDAFGIQRNKEPAETPLCHSHFDKWKEDKELSKA